MAKDRRGICFGARECGTALVASLCRRACSLRSLTTDHLSGGCFGAVIGARGIGFDGLEFGTVPYDPRRVPASWRTAGK